MPYFFLHTSKTADCRFNLHNVHHIPECGVDSVESGMTECLRRTRFLGVLRFPHDLFLWLVFFQLRYNVRKIGNMSFAARFGLNFIYTLVGCAAFVGLSYDLPALGISLTENGAMLPHASVCGLYLASPHAYYFSVRS